VREFTSAVTGLPFTVIETATIRVSSSNQDPKALPVARAP